VEKTRGDGYKLHVERFCLDTRGKFFAIGTINYRNSLPSEVVYSPTLDAFKIQLDRVLGHAV